MAKTSTMPPALLPLSPGDYVPIVQQGKSRRAELGKALTPHLPVGWVDPNEYTNVVWAEVWPWKRYSDGYTIWRMMPDNSLTRAGWRIPGAPRVRNPDDGLYYVGIKPSLVFDPCLQGVAVTERTVHVTAGSNANPGSDALPFKTVDFAIAIINGLGAGTYRIIVKSDDFICGNSEGWDATSYTLGAGVKLHIEIRRRADGRKPAYVPGIRRLGYRKADFAWSHLGGNLYKCVNPLISAAAKNTPMVLDLKTLDSRGFPTPSEGLTGALADDAAVIAAANGRPVYYYRAGDGAHYLRLASGEEPDPGNNYAYVEQQTALAFLLNEGARLKVSGLAMAHNTSVVTQSGLYARPSTVVLGPAQPVVDHDIEVVFEDCEVAGVSGNGITLFDIRRGIVQGCKTAYCWLDAVNQSTFYTPGNSNGVAMGNAQHMLVLDHLDDWHGPNGFKDQPTVNTSSNGPTTHSRCNMEVDNSSFARSFGSNAAAVGGAKMLLLNVELDDPSVVTPSEDVYPACYLSSGNSAYDVNLKSSIYALFCRGSARPTCRHFYVGPTARMVQAHYRGHYTKQVAAGGILENGYGVAL